VDEGSFTSGNIVDGCWNCINLVRKCGNVDRNIEIYFRNVSRNIWKFSVKFKPQTTVQLRLNDLYTG